MSAWSKQRIDWLREKVCQGLDGPQLAKQHNETFGLNMTRNAMLAQVRRLGLNISSPAALRKTWSMGEAEPRGIRPAPSLKTVQAPPMTPDDVPFLIRDEPREPYSGPKTILQIGFGQCRWILQDQDHLPAPSRLFCAAPTVRGSYCCEHIGRIAAAHQPGIPRAADKTTFMFPKKARAA